MSIFSKVVVAKPSSINVHSTFPFLSVKKRMNIMHTPRESPSKKTNRRRTRTKFCKTIYFLLFGVAILYFGVLIVLHSSAYYTEQSSAASLSASPGPPFDGFPPSSSISPIHHGIRGTALWFSDRWGTTTPSGRNAYAFLLAGVGTDPQHDYYKGLLYNIVVSARILKNAGSKADIIVMVQMQTQIAFNSQHPTTLELPEEDVKLLEALHVQIRYLPPSQPNFAVSVLLEKFRILEFTEYTRVIYMDPDVMPFCNLDYIFDLSQGPDAIIKENLLLSVQNVPSSSRLFMLQPGKGKFDRLQQIVLEQAAAAADNKKLEPYYDFDPVHGWGHVMNETTGDGWRSLGGRRGTNWTWDGVKLDQGLLYYWAKFEQQSTSIVIGNQVENWSRLQNGTMAVENTMESPFQYYSCLPISEEGNGFGRQWWKSKTLQKDMSPKGVAPYRDIALSFRESKPWGAKQTKMTPRPPGIFNWVNTAKQYWWYILRRVSHDLPDGGGLHLQVDNWKKVVVPPFDRYPVASTSATTMYALHQWARNKTAPSREMLLEMITPTTILDAAENNSKIDIWTEMLYNPTQCPLCKRRPTTKQVEMCSKTNPHEFPRYLSSRRPACPRAVRHHAHVILPFYNLDESAIGKALCSVQCQNYPVERTTIWLYDDGSDKQGSEAMLQNICDGQVIEFDPPTENDDKDDAFHVSKTVAGLSKARTSNTTAPICFRAPHHLGPAGGKYWAFRLVGAVAEPNDVVVVLDGDDELGSPQALKVINEKYIDEGAWFTYGSHEGKYSEQTLPIPEEMTSKHGRATAPFVPRRDHPTWRFGHPRTFKAHLMTRMGREDFTYEDGSWLVKATDRGFVYRMLELSGTERVGYITEQIYKYNWSSLSSTLSVVDKATRDAHLQHVKKLVPSSQLQLPIHVVLVCWSRIYLLKHQLVWLQEQTSLDGRLIKLHLLNNNMEQKQDIEDIVGNFHSWQANATLKEGVLPVEVAVIHNEENWHAFSRFLYVDELRRQEPMDSVIFVDDDQFWQPSFVASLMKEHKPKGMTTWYGKNFVLGGKKKKASTKWQRYWWLPSSVRDFLQIKKRKQHSSNSKPAFDNRVVDYWKSSITWSDIILDNKQKVTNFTYGGPGGSIFDTNLWLFDHQLLRLKHDLKRFFMFDDVWSSYVLDGLLGWEQRRLQHPIPIDLANCNHTHYAHIFAKTPNRQKQLLKLHKVIGDKLASSGTFQLSTDSKNEMFTEIQDAFHWDVTRATAVPEKRAFVCITGQFEQLELEKKTSTLFGPLISAGYDVDLALVLSEGESGFTNLNSPKQAENRPNATVPFFTHPSQVMHYVSTQTNVRLLSYNISYPKLQNPAVHEQYVDSLYEAHKLVRTREEQHARAANHGRIFESYQRCLDIADKEDAPYDVYVRIRDDVAFKDRLRPENLNVPANTIVVNPCRGRHGMNDQFAIVSPDAANRYFKRPYDVFSKGGHIDPRVVVNPETFLLDVFTEANINVLASRIMSNIYRVYRSEYGEDNYYPDDVDDPGCPEIVGHEKEMITLFGLSF